MSLNLENIKEVNHQGELARLSLATMVRATVLIKFGKWTTNSNNTPRIQLYISPIALAAGIFSMNEQVIPFKTLNFGLFVCATVVFGVLGIVIYYLEPFRQLGKLARWGFIGRIRRHGEMKKQQQDEEYAGGD